jgi:3-oxo-5,6-didehydrosuberyl-CoA/3-oxoadipyl-CoA thiolase
MDLIELNEAFAARRWACSDSWGWRMMRMLTQRRRHRLRPSVGNERRPLALSASLELQRRGGRYALCTMCIGVGQGIAMILERV